MPDVGEVRSVWPYSGVRAGAPRLLRVVDAEPLPARDLHEQIVVLVEVEYRPRACKKAATQLRARSTSQLADLAEDSRACGRGAADKELAALPRAEAARLGKRPNGLQVDPAPDVAPRARGQGQGQRPGSGPEARVRAGARESKAGRPIPRAPHPLAQAGAGQEGSLLDRAVGRRLLIN